MVYNQSHMDIRIKTTDYHMTPEVSAYLDERIEAIAKLLASDAEASRCEVEVGRSVGNVKHGNVWFAEINVESPGVDRMRATADAETVNAAIDQAKDEVVRQLRKYRGFHRRFMRRSGAAFKWMMKFGREE